MTLNLKQIETLPAIFRLSYSIQKSKKESTTSNLLKYSTKTAKSQSIREISTYSNSRDILMCFTFESQGHRLITTIEKQEKPFYLREKKPSYPAHMHVIIQMERATKRYSFTTD